jgi:hypothetical protein
LIETEAAELVGYFLASLWVVKIKLDSAMLQLDAIMNETIRKEVEIEVLLSLMANCGLDYERLP